MMNYILWNGNSELFSIGAFTLRWNALLLILAYLISRQILFYIYKKENKPSIDVTTLTAYLIISTLIGARFGHVVFYQPELIWKNPLEIFFPFEFQQGFHFTATQGFSIYGAAIGILIGLWLYSRKNKPGQNYFQVLDRITMLASVTGFLLLTGSFLNSDIIGKPTDSKAGTVFIKPVSRGLLKQPCCVMRTPNGKNPLEKVIAKKGDDILENNEGHPYILLYLFFKPGVSEQLVKEFLIGDVKSYLFDMATYVDEPGTEPLHYTIIVEKDGNYVGRVITRGIPRYPVQLYEAITSLMLFIFLWWSWSKQKTNTPPARLFGYFMTLFWSLHLVFGFMKEKQVPVETGLNILFILTGIIALLYSYRKIPVLNDSIKAKG